MDVLMLVGGIALAGVLIWMKAAPKLVAVLALVVSANLAGGLVGRWLVAGIDMVSGWCGHTVAYLTGWSAGQVATAVPFALGVAVLAIFVRQMWPKKGKAGPLTAAAAFLLPQFWVAITVGLETIAPGSTGGGA